MAVKARNYTTPVAAGEKFKNERGGKAGNLNIKMLRAGNIFCWAANLMTYETQLCGKLKIKMSVWAENSSRWQLQGN
jgi:hypothetical protein